MENYRWDLLTQIIENLSDSSEIPKNIMSVIALHAEEAISAPGAEPLATLSKQLTELWQALYRSVPKETAEAVRMSKTSSPIAAAYLLGQVNFAQLMLSQASLHRASDEFIPTLFDNGDGRYARLLFEKDYSVREIAEISKEKEGDVQKSLSRLVCLGIADMRHGNTGCVTYFLTPAARAVIETK